MVIGFAWRLACLLACFIDDLNKSLCVFEGMVLWRIYYGGVYII